MRIHTKRFEATVLFMLMLLVPSIALAQRDSPSQRYLFGSLGSWTEAPDALVGVGFGYERTFYKGLAAGGEIQGWGNPSGGGNGYGGLTLSGNASYHFRNVGASRKLVPFATGGYTRLSVCGGGCGGINGFNLGGGVNYWFTPRKGLRLEFRDHVLLDGYAFQKWETRIGFAF